MIPQNVTAGISSIVYGDTHPFLLVTDTDYTFVVLVSFGLILFQLLGVASDHH